VNKGGEKMRRIWYKAIFTGLAVVFMAVSAQAADMELVFQSWGGFTEELNKECFGIPFEKETGIKVVYARATGDMMGKVATQVRSGNVEWDIITPSDIAIMEAAAKNGLLEPIDYSIVTNTKDFIPGSVTKYGLGHEYTAFLITYNNKVFTGDKVPNSWADFYDPVKFPGARANHTNWGGPLWHYFSALLADGVPFDKLVPIDYDRAFKVLDRSKAQTKVWYSSGDKVMQVLVEKEVVMAHTTDARAKSAMALGFTGDVVWNQALTFLNYRSVVKGAPHKEAAMKFLNWYASHPEQTVCWSRKMNVSLSNAKTMTYLSPEAQKTQALYPENFKKVIGVFTEKNTPWLIDHQAEMLEKWNAWISK
jgi:spermidine/putrescine-binding protein